MITVWNAISRFLFLQGLIVSMHKLCLFMNICVYHICDKTIFYQVYYCVINSSWSYEIKKCGLSVIKPLILAEQGFRLLGNRQGLADWFEWRERRLATVEGWAKKGMATAVGRITEETRQCPFVWRSTHLSNLLNVNWFWTKFFKMVSLCIVALGMLKPILGKAAYKPKARSAAGLFGKHYWIHWDIACDLLLVCLVLSFSSFSWTNYEKICRGLQLVGSYLVSVFRIAALQLDFCALLSATELNRTYSPKLQSSAASTLLI